MIATFSTRSGSSLSCSVQVKVKFLFLVLNSTFRLETDRPVRIGGSLKSPKKPIRSPSKVPIGIGAVPVLPEKFQPPSDVSFNDARRVSSILDATSLSVVAICPLILLVSSLVKSRSKDLIESLLSMIDQSLLEPAWNLKLLLGTTVMRRTL